MSPHAHRGRRRAERPAARAVRRRRPRHHGRAERPGARAGLHVPRVPADFEEDGDRGGVPPPLLRRVHPEVPARRQARVPELPHQGALAPQPEARRGLRRAHRDGLPRPRRLRARRRGRDAAVQREAAAPDGRPPRRGLRAARGPAAPQAAAARAAAGAGPRATRPAARPLAHPAAAPARRPRRAPRRPSSTSCCARTRTRRASAASRAST